VVLDRGGGPRNVSLSGRVIWLAVRGSIRILRIVLRITTLVSRLHIFMPSLPAWKSQLSNSPTSMMSASRICLAFQRVGTFRFRLSPRLSVLT
jgi:hypothetical protein